MGKQSRIKKEKESKRKAAIKEEKEAKRELAERSELRAEVRAHPEQLVRLPVRIDTYFSETVDRQIREEFHIFQYTGGSEKGR